MKKLVFIILLFTWVVKAQANCATGVVPTPVVDSITVDIAGNVTICWQAVVDPDIVSYKIFMVNPFTNANDSINIVGSGATCYTIPAGMNPSDTKSIQLGVVAVDVCNNLSAVGANYHNTIFLQNTVDICAASIDLSWNAYDDFTSGPNVLYQIFVSQNAGAYVLAGTSPTTNYTYGGIVNGVTYDFYVRAIENFGAGPFSSSSNDININTVAFLKDPTFSYLYTATVASETQIDIQFYVDTAADIRSYIIKRSTSATGVFTDIATIPAFVGMNPLITYSDYDVETKANPYFYKVETINKCGDLKFTSNIGRTIWVNVVGDKSTTTDTLTITQYEDWAGGVQKYDIYRALGGIWESTPIATISSFIDTMVFIDNIGQVSEGDGEFCYKVIATENPFAHVGGLPEATSTSNETCVIHQPLLYVPNAFAPLGDYNTTFKPVLTFSDPLSYSFQIYNKWGQKIFETNNPTVGWNGQFENTGKMCQSDSYVYAIQFKSADGDEYKKRGVVTLLN